MGANTTLNIYTHVTGDMQKTAAAKIDQGIGRGALQKEELPSLSAESGIPPIFEPYKGKIRKRGTGCVTKINDHLWEGRYTPTWPDGKRRARNIYAHTEAECEQRLAEMIAGIKAEIAREKAMAL